MFVGQVGEDQKHADYMDVYRSKLHSEAGEKTPGCIERGEQ